VTCRVSFRLRGFFQQMRALLNIPVLFEFLKAATPFGAAIANLRADRKENQFSVCLFLFIVNRRIVL
jgi:hypothetical protein